MKTRNKPNQNKTKKLPHTHVHTHTHPILNLESKVNTLPIDSPKYTEWK